jgi:hypothetical protein
VKFRDDLEPYLGGARIPRERGHGLQSERAQRLFRDLQSVGADWSKAVTLDEARVNAMRIRAERSLGRAIADFNDYFILTLPAGAEAGRWLDELNALPEVELATPLPLPVPAPLAEDFTPLQGYLTPATAGTDATYAWTIPGGTGAGVTICDVESNWNLNHLDLPPVSVFLPPGTISTPTDDPDGHHGTAVLGEMGSLPNGWGTTGASYGAAFAAVPVRLNNQYQVPLALLEAITHLVPGDVILIEQQITGPEGVGLAPVEWNQASYYAVLTAVGNGIHVVEAAGNGSMISTRHSSRRHTRRSCPRTNPAQSW